MSPFPTAGHLVSWAKLSPRTIQSGPRTAPARPAKATPTSRASSARLPPRPARTDTFLGERYRRLARRRGKLKALVAIARSILVIVWHLLADRGRPLPRPRRRLLRQPHRHRTARPATTSASSKPSATPSPSHPPPDQPLHTHPAPPGAAADHLGLVIFRLAGNPSSSLLDGLGRVRRVKAKPANAGRFANLDTAATAKGGQL